MSQMYQIFLTEFLMENIDIREQATDGAGIEFFMQIITIQSMLAPLTFPTKPMVRVDPEVVFQKQMQHYIP